MLKGGDDAKTSHGCTELLGGLDPPLDLNQTLVDFSDVSYLQAILFENPTAFSGFLKKPSHISPGKQVTLLTVTSNCNNTDRK